MNVTIKPRLAIDKKFCNKSKNLKQTWNIFLDLSMKTFLLLVSSQSFKFICIGYLGNFLFLLQKSDEKLDKESYSLALFVIFDVSSLRQFWLKSNMNFNMLLNLDWGLFLKKKKKTLFSIKIDFSSKFWNTTNNYFKDEKFMGHHG